MARGIGNKGLVFFVGVCITAVWMASDMYLPALPVLDEALGTTEAVVNASLMVNMICMAVGSLVGGPVSDKVGRRKPMIAGASAMVVFNVLCSTVTSAGALIILRVFAGIGGGFVASVSMAVLKDRLPQEELAGAISLTQSLAILGPLAAPFLGSLMITLVSWRGIFILLATMAAVCLLWYLPVGETLPPEKRDDVSILGALGLIWQVAKNPSFTVLLVAFCLAPLAFGVFMVECSYVFLDFFEMSYMGYSVCYFIAMVVEFAAPFLFTVLEKRLSYVRIMWVIIALLVIAGALLLTVGPWGPVLFLVGCAPFVIAEGMARPFAFLVLLGGAESHSGAASALVTFGVNFFTGLGSPLASLPIWPNHVVATGVPSLLCAILTAVLVLILLGPMKSTILQKK